MLTLSLFIPLVGAVVVFGLPRDNQRLLRSVSLVFAAVPLALLAVVWARFAGTGGLEQIESATWIPSLGVTYKLGVDGISLPLAALTALLFMAAIAYPGDLRGRAKAYFAAFLFLEAVSLGVFLALDLFLFYVFWDLNLVGMYFLIAVWGHGDSQRSALKFFLYTLAGSLAMLLAILGLYLATTPRTFDMIEIIHQQPLRGAGAGGALIFIGFALGFGIKTPIFPFHTWLPPAHVDAPAPASTILAGVLLKMGPYGLIRILMPMMPEQFRRFALLLAVLGVASIVYGALVVIAQTNLKRLVAYSSVTHMGYVILGVAAAGALGNGREAARALALSGATLEMIAHGLITGALFLISGSFYQRSGTYDLDRFGGLAGKAHAMTGATVLASFASLGLPGLAGFVAEFQIFVGSFAIFPVLAGIGLLGIVLLAAAFLRMLQKAFLGPLREELSAWRDLGKVEVLALIPLLALVVLIGVAPAWLLDVINGAAGILVGR